MTLMLRILLLAMLSGCVQVTINGDGNTVTVTTTIAPISTVTVPAMTGLPGGL